MLIVYIVLVCLGFILVTILNIMIAASRKKRRNNEIEPQSYEKFSAYEDERQAKARDVMMKYPK